MRPTDYETRLLISSRKLPYMSGSPDTFYVELRAHKFTNDGHVRNFSLGSWPCEPLADLIISTQVDTATESGSYAFEVAYQEPHRVKLEHMEQMVKVLRKVDRHLRRAIESYGYPTNFSEYVARVAAALGVKKFGYVSVRNPHGWAHDDQEYTWVSVDSARAYIDDLIAGLRSGEMQPDVVR
jgi:hypothetical protein